MNEIVRGVSATSGAAQPGADSTAVVAAAPRPAAASGPAHHTPRLSARERLLAAADELFYENGINTVGIDRIIERAGVAKASLYDCFGSKDELVRAYLQQRSAAREARINERMWRYATPEEKILSLFDLLAEVISQPGYRGCAFARAGADANSSQGVKTTCGESRASLLHKLTELAREAGANDPELLGRQLVLLYDGASTAAYMDGDRNAASVARTLAEQMLSNAGKAKRTGKRSR
jgi:AcrR family transcriptional regulator